MKLELAPTTADDADILIRIRLEAMRPSLECIGRFDPQRARDRFLSGFEPAYCRYIRVDGMDAGLVTVRPDADHLALEHLYVLPAYQGRGIGAQVLRGIFDEADARSLPVRVGALRGSDSNRFYQRHGFVQTHETEWDIHYVREPARA